jgi:hypothetical protein
MLQRSAFRLSLEKGVYELSALQADKPVPIDKAISKSRFAGCYWTGEQNDAARQFQLASGRKDHQAAA